MTERSLDHVAYKYLWKKTPGQIIEFFNEQVIKNQ